MIHIQSEIKKFRLQNGLWLKITESAFPVKVYFFYVCLCAIISIFCTHCDAFAVCKKYKELLQRTGIYYFLLNGIDDSSFKIILSI